MSRSPQRLGRGGRTRLALLTVASPLLALAFTAGASAAAVSKSTPTPWIEPQDQAIYDLAYSNDTDDTIVELDLIDVLPRAGDVRGAGSSFHGSVTLRSVVPAAPGDVVSYTSTPPADVSSNPGDPSNAPGTGSTVWCTSVQLGTAGCPTDVAAATAVRIVQTGLIPSGAGGTARIVLDTAGNQSGDRYVNDAGLCAYSGGGSGGNSRIVARDADGGVCVPGQAPTVYADPVAVRVVASNLGDFVWNDSNHNGIQDPGEPGIPGVTVTLTGTDKDRNAVERTVVTDGNGRYTFATADGHFTLRSGLYQLAFAKAGYDFTLQGAGDDRGLDSDVDPLTGRTPTITIPSPIATATDGEDLSWDAGLVLPVPPATATPAAPPPAPRHALSIRKRANHATVRAGHRVVYTLTVRADRQGTEDAVGERVCDSLPRHLGLVSRGGGRLRDGRLCWTITRLAPGGTAVHRLVARVDRDAPAGRLTNTATVTDQGRTRTARRSVRVLAVPIRAATAGGVTG